MVNLNNTHRVFCELLYNRLNEILQISLEDNFIHSSQNYSERKFVHNSNYNLSYFLSNQLENFLKHKKSRKFKIGTKKGL